MKTKPKKADAFKTKKLILEFLKQNGPRDAASLARALDVTGMAIRQHLYELQDQKLVSYQEEPRAKGRPAKLWQLTSAADSYFPDAHHDLTVQLMQGIRHTFGEEGMQKLLKTRAKQATKDYGAVITKDLSLKQKLNKLKAIRTKEGYMAEVKKGENGNYLFIENHCPICVAAKACQGLCEVELSTFSNVLGPEYKIKRIEHILAGGRRCVYEVSGKV